MKKVIISSLVLLVSSAQANQSVVGAAYAVITGAKGGRLVITRGANSREHGVVNDSMNMISSGIEYYNYRGESVPFVGKRLTHLEGLDLSSENVSTDCYERNVEEIRASLTDLPEARSAKLMLSNTAPGRQSVQVFDKDGHLIRSTTFAKWGSFRIGSPLPQAAQEELKEWVRNPEELSLLSITEIRER